MKNIAPIAPVLKDNLLRLAHEYSRASGRSLSTIGGHATRTPGFFTKLETDEKTSFTVRKYDEIVAWFIAQDWHGVEIPKLQNPEHHERTSHGTRQEVSSQKAGRQKGKAGIKETARRKVSTGRGRDAKAARAKS